MSEMVVFKDYLSLSLSPSLHIQSPSSILVQTAHMVWGADLRLCFFTWSSNIFSLALSWLGRTQSSQVKSILLSSPAGVVWAEGPAPPHHLGVTELVQDLAQAWDGPGHVPNTPHSMIFSGDAHHAGLPPLTNDSNGKYFKPRRLLQPSAWWSPDFPGTVQIILGPHRHHTGSPALAPALTSADTPAPSRQIYLGLRHCLFVCFILWENCPVSGHWSPQYNFRQGSFPAILIVWFVSEISQ